MMVAIEREQKRERPHMVAERFPNVFVIMVHQVNFDIAAFKMGLRWWGVLGLESFPGPRVSG
jgi:hypothetical protein